MRVCDLDRKIVDLYSFTSWKIILHFHFTCDQCFHSLYIAQQTDERNTTWFLSQKPPWSINNFSQQLTRRCLKMSRENYPSTSHRSTGSLNIRLVSYHDLISVHRKIQQFFVPIFFAQWIILDFLHNRLRLEEIIRMSLNGAQSKQFKTNTI